MFWSIRFGQNLLKIGLFLVKQVNQKLSTNSCLSILFYIRISEKKHVSFRKEDIDFFNRGLSRLIFQLMVSAFIKSCKNRDWMSSNHFTQPRFMSATTELMLCLISPTFLIIHDFVQVIHLKFQSYSFF